MAGPVITDLQHRFSGVAALKYGAAAKAGDQMRLIIIAKERNACGWATAFDVAAEFGQDNLGDKGQIERARIGQRHPLQM